MTETELLMQRMKGQALDTARFETTQEAVAYFGAVQAQDYPAAKWGLGQRIRQATDARLDQAFAEGQILRTHVMRPTWHFVAPADIRWLQALTAGRVEAQMAYYSRQAGLDREDFARSHKVIGELLRGGRQLTRREIGTALQQSEIDVTNPLRLAHILSHAELQGLVCSGALRGKQHTYALLDERVPPTPALPREEALAKLARRYFISHGPAMLKDFTWWSGLTGTEANQGLQAVRSQLTCEAVDGMDYWCGPSGPATEMKNPAVRLLPNYDEYIVAYTDRSAIFDLHNTEKLDARQNPLFQNTILINGRLAGTWKRTVNKKEVVVQLNPFVSFDPDEQRAMAEELRRYGAFMELPIRVEGE